MLSRAVWSSRKAGHILLRHLIAVERTNGSAGNGALTILPSRRRGKRIAAKGIYRDPVRSSDSHLVKASGLRWLSLMLKSANSLGTAGLGITVSNSFSPNTQRYHQQRNHRHKQRLGLGQTNGTASAAMGADASDSCGCLLQLCRVGTVVHTLPDEQHNRISSLAYV